LEGTVFEQNDQPEDHVYEQDLKAIIEQSLDQCTPRQAKVLRLRFGIGCKEHTLWEAGVVFNIGAEIASRQIEAKALRHLRELGSEDGALKDLRVEEFGAASLKKKNFWEDFDARMQAHHDQNVSQEGGE
jgi:DNA-directed RNA polymerase sigma subunit (sigma70/sigma32)